MRPESIDSIRDPRIADYLNVRDGDLRHARGLFMAEGRLVVRTLLEESSLRPRSLFLTPTSLEALNALLTATEPVCPVFVAEQEIFNEIVGFNMHRGCLAAGERGRDLGLEALLQSGPAVLVVAEGLTDVDNVGSLFRNARAFGAGGLLLCPRSCDPLYRKAIRTSMGASLCLPFARAATWPGALSSLKSAGYELIALDTATDSEDVACLREIGSSEAQRVALIVGSEGPGLSAEVLELADRRLRIPMVPEADSLNVATAAAIALHQLHRGWTDRRPKRAQG